MPELPRDSTTTTNAFGVFNPERLPLEQRAHFRPLRIFVKERRQKGQPDWEQWTPEDERGRRVVAELSPLPASEILASITARANRPGMTLLLGFESMPGGGAAALAAIGETSRSLHDFLETVGPQSAAAGPRFLLLDDVALLRLLRRGLAGFTSAVRVEPGEHDRIEVSDLESILQAVDAGASPLEADLRTIAWLRFGPDSKVEVVSRRRAVVHELVAEAMALYLASQLGVQHREVVRPEAWRVAQLLGVSGHLELHPRETLVTSTFVDVGCCCSAPSERHPAAVGVIYDLPSRSWHGEEG
ncbi:MAG: hypothetical protein KF724_02790 [Phycisphaeraceae bacterium]|nr:hypothetical protein [Phycisphaeraceae bacterium]